MHKKTHNILQRFKGWRFPYARRQATHDTELDMPLRCGSPDQSTINKIKMAKRNKKLKVTLPKI